MIQEEVAAVKELMHNSSLSAEEKCPLLYKKYTQLVQDHKLQERKMAEALRKQLEVCHLADLLSYKMVCKGDFLGQNTYEIALKINHVKFFETVLWKPLLTNILEPRISSHFLKNIFSGKCIDCQNCCHYGRFSNSRN